MRRSVKQSRPHPARFRRRARILGNVRHDTHPEVKPGRQSLLPPIPSDPDRELRTFARCHVSRPEFFRPERIVSPDATDGEQVVSTLHSGLSRGAPRRDIHHVNSGAGLNGRDTEARLTNGVASETKSRQRQNRVPLIRLPPVDVSRVEIGERFAVRRAGDRRPPFVRSEVAAYLAGMRLVDGAGSAARSRTGIPGASTAGKVRSLML